jgi:hypothetical protein
MSENEAPEMDELNPSPEKDHDASAVEKIAKEMGMNVMRVDDANLMPEMKELPQLELPAEITDCNMSVDICQNDEKEDPIEDPIIACAPDISSTDTADENTASETISADEKQVLAEKDLNKSMSDEEYKQFLHTPPKACSTQKSASQESNAGKFARRKNTFNFLENKMTQPDRTHRLLARNAPGAASHFYFQTSIRKICLSDRRYPRLRSLFLYILTKA